MAMLRAAISAAAALALLAGTAAKMLAALRARAERAGLEARIETRLARESSLGVDDLAGKVD